MKKTIAIVVFLIVIAGFLSALEIKNSTFFGGVSFDYITANGKEYDIEAKPFKTTVSGLSVYGGYDVQFGNRLYTRLEYEYLILPTSFNFKGDEVSGEILKRSGSKKRVGAYVVIGKSDSNIKFNLGGAITNVTMGVSLNEDGIQFEYVQDLIGLGLIIEGVYSISNHFTARFGIVPDVTLLTIDRLDFGYRDMEDSIHKTSETRSTLLAMGFSVSARAGLSYKF